MIPGNTYDCYYAGSGNHISGRLIGIEYLGDQVWACIEAEDGTTVWLNLRHIRTIFEAVAE